MKTQKRENGLYGAKGAHSGLHKITCARQIDMIKAVRKRCEIKKDKNKAKASSFCFIFFIVYDIMYAGGVRHL